MALQPKQEAGKSRMEVAMPIVHRALIGAC